MDQVALAKQTAGCLRRMCQQQQRRGSGQCTSCEWWCREYWPTFRSGNQARCRRGGRRTLIHWRIEKQEAVLRVARGRCGDAAVPCGGHQSQDGTAVCSGFRIRAVRLPPMSCYRRLLLGMCCLPGTMCGRGPLRWLRVTEFQFLGFPGMPSATAKTTRSCETTS